MAVTIQGHQQNIVGSKKRSGTLYIVSTPLGNLEDITLRAIRTLREADIIAAEDTRHSLKLLSHLGITGKPIVSYWGEREKAKSEEVIGLLKEGKDVALISDAGTPGISDPGAVLVRSAIDNEIAIVPIPGASALVAAVSVSGLSTEEFTFAGFLPAKRGARQRALKDFALEPRTLIFYESPHRIIDTLIDMEEVFGGERRAVLSREITKMHEETVRETLGGILDYLEADAVVAGEYVVMIEGYQRGEAGEAASEEEAVAEVAALIRKGMGRKEAVKQIASQYKISKKELYDRSLKDEQAKED